MKEFAHPKTKEKLPVALNAIIERATTICRGEWKHNAELELALEDSLPTVLGSEGELNQVVLNLVVNASHAIGDSGQAKGRITVTSQSIKTGVRLEVRENGGGIPEAARERVFDAFFTTKEVGKRSGQGLAICHDVIVNKHGGTIRFETETGVGTAFIIDLPFEIAVVSETALTATDFPLREILLRPRPDTFGAMLDLIEHLRPIDGHDFSVPDDIATVDEDVCDVAAARIVD
jgi:signal transduction histidine kinase